MPVTHREWEMALAISRKIETGGRNADSNDNAAIEAEHQTFVDLFSLHLKPPARVLAPGAMGEAVLLARAGFETHALVLGPDNVKWLNEQKARLPDPSRLIVREVDAHSLDYPKEHFDGYFSIQFHEHLLSWWLHLMQVYYCMKDGGIVFCDAAGVTHRSMYCIWHTNLVPEKIVFDQWSYWGFRERWRGPNGDDRPRFIFEKMRLDDPQFENAGYLQHVLGLRDGKPASYAYNCDECG